MSGDIAAMAPDSTWAGSPGAKLTLATAKLGLCRMSTCMTPPVLQLGSGRGTGIGILAG